MRYQYVLFDLDGTLTESGEGIKKSIAYALSMLGVPPLSDAQLDKYIGPPLYTSFLESGVPKQDISRGEDFFHDRYHEVGWRENRVYPGIPRLLKSLRKNGAFVAVATAKPQVFAEKILRHFCLADYVDRIVGVELDNRVSEKTALIERALPEGADRAKACMVGDRLFDMEAAKATGVFPVGAGYGYGSTEELVRSGAEWVAGDVRDLTDFLLGDSPAEPGWFFTFEGTDGCGKSTQIAMAEQWLSERGYETVVTREPGGCPISERIRQVVLDVKALGMTDECEALLFAASRAQHVHDTILPALRAGKIVLCDRFLDSSIAYQAHGRELGESFVRQINAPALKCRQPDRTLYYSVDADTAAERVRKGSQPDRIELEKAAYFDRVRRAYEALLLTEPNRFRRVDANRSISEVFEDTKACLRDFLLDKE